MPCRQMRSFGSALIRIIMIGVTSSRADLLTLNAVPGTGSTSGWVAGGATVGDDASAPGGTASTYTGRNPNRRLFVPIADPTVDTTMTIYWVKVRVLARSDINLAGTYDGLKVGINLNGTDYLDPAIDEQNTTYFYYEHSWQRNPATSSAWRWSDITAIRAGCVTAKTARSQTTTYYVDHVQIVVEFGTGSNGAPTASEVTISGRDTVGEILTGAYRYADADNDPEGISRFAWYRADDPLGTNMAAISYAGGTGTVCVIPPVAEGRYIFFEVLPVAASGVTEGTPVLSPAFGPIWPAAGRAPVASNVTVLGEPKVWQTLTGSYTYSDPDGDPEGGTLLRWLRDGTAIPGANSFSYVLTPEDVGAMILFEVTPVAATGTPKGGTPVLSSPLGPVEAAVGVPLSATRVRHSGAGRRRYVFDLRGRLLSQSASSTHQRLPYSVCVVQMKGNSKQQTGDRPIFILGR